MFDPTGMRFGRLTCLSKTSEKSGSNYLWLFRCDCGQETKTTASRASSGNTQSCGCIRRELALRNNEARVSHGLSRRGAHHDLYKTWEGMIARCESLSRHEFKYYGARGIRVCDRWRNSFTYFVTDMGDRPSRKHSIDRIDVDGDYTPSNCRWADPFMQARNKRCRNQIPVSAGCSVADATTASEK